MKVLQINAVDSIGSTGTIMSDIQDVCTRNGIECHIAYSVTRRHKADILNGYHIGNWFDHKLHALLSRIFRKQAYFSTIPTWFFLRYIDRLKPDVVHLHNLHANYINLNMLLKHLAKRDIATVATLHDNWFFTGGCYLPELEHCTKWQTGCKNCPLNKKGYNRFLRNTSEQVLRDRKDYFNAIKRLTVVGVSDWMSGEARKSIFRNAEIKTIRNGVRTDVFCPMPADARKELRTKYGFNDSDFVILAPASKWLDPRNTDGFNYIVNNLKQDEVLVLYGCSNLQMKQKPLQHRDRLRLIPYIHNQALLSTIYSMADVMINCTHMDTCSFINIECQACGTPVVTFDNTGAAETIDGKHSFSVLTEDYEHMLTIVRSIKQHTLDNVNPTVNNVKKQFNMSENYRRYVELYKNYRNI